MRNLIILLCTLCAPLASSRPQYSVEAQIVGSQQPLGQPQLQAFTDSPDANIIAFSPERTRVRPASGRSQSRFHATPQLQPVRPAVPEQYYVQQAAQVPQAVPQQPLPQQFTAVPQIQQPQPQPLPQQQPQPQPQPQFRERTRQQYTTQAPEEESTKHQHPPTPPIQIIKLDKSQSLDGSYKQSWESANNIIVEETGYLKDLGSKDEKALVQQGTYSYQAPDGTVITTSYTADEGGFKVEGSHLPTPPPIPDEIQRGLNQIYEGIRLQQEQDAKDLKEGKIRPKQYDDLTGLPIEDSPQSNVPQTPVQPIPSQRRHYQQYQAAPVQHQPQPHQPIQQVVQQQYQPQYQQVPEQAQLFQRQQYRQ